MARRPGRGAGPCGRLREVPGDVEDAGDVGTPPPGCERWEP
ncbi:MAG: hypothetical protein ACRD03_07645 [Acidimicrobiales bacterium]